MSNPHKFTRLPPYAYFPGGPWPHPTRTSAGHSHGRHEPTPTPIDPRLWRGSAEYREAIDLFNAGYYWEAHEVWERLWHVHGRRGPIADLLKALIKLAACGVKVREGRPAGVSTHATRAAALLESIRAEVGSSLLGLDLQSLEAIARTISVDPPKDKHPREVAVARVLPFELEPE